MRAKSSAAAIVRRGADSLALQPGQTKVIPPGPRRDRGLETVISVASSPSSLAAILVALIEYQRLHKKRPATIEYTRKKAAWILDYFGPAMDANAFTLSDIESYVRKRRKDIIITGFPPKPIRNLERKLRDARADIAAGKSWRRAARAVSIPVHRLRLELETKPKKLVSDATIQKEVDVLLQALRVAKKNHFYHGDESLLRFEAVELPDPKERSLTHSEYAKLELAIRPDRKDWVLTFVRTGCRYSELHRIRRNHIDHENRRVKLIGYKGRKKRKQVPRYVPLADDAYVALCSLSETAKGPLLFPHLSGCPVATRPDDEEGVLCSCRSDFHRILRVACRKAEIETVTPNDLRRTYASLMVRAGVAEPMLKKFMGHSSTSKMLIEIYLKLQADEGHVQIAKLLQEGQEAVARLQALRPTAEPAKAPRGRRVVRRG